MVKHRGSRVRLTARIPGRLRDTLEQAAELPGATFNQFVVQSAFAETQRVLERETQIQLSQRDAQKVFGLQAPPPKPSRALKAAVKASQPAGLGPKPQGQSGARLDRFAKRALASGAGQWQH